MEFTDTDSNVEFIRTKNGYNVFQGRCWRNALKGRFSQWPHKRT